MTVISPPIQFTNANRSHADRIRSAFLDRYLDFAINSAKSLAELNDVSGGQFHNFDAAIQDVHESVKELLWYVQDRERSQHLSQKFETLRSYSR